MFANRGAPDIFHTYLADLIDVTVVSQHFNIENNDKTMQTFHGSIYNGVSQALKVETITVEVVRIVGGGESPWASVQSVCTATSKYGEWIFVIINLSVALEPISLIRMWCSQSRDTLPVGICGHDSIQLRGKDC